MTSWQPYREPLWTTLLRTGLIALVLGAVLSHWWGGLARWPRVTLLMLWPSFGGHWVELWFLNWVRPRISAARGGRWVQVGARLAVWFAGGIVLGLGMALTGLALAAGRTVPGPAWWVAGLGFIGIELVAHLFLQVRGRPSFYNGRG